MLQLHVWGYKDNVSLIEPECFACITFLSSIGTPFEVVFSNNTNLSPVNKLPILITENGERIPGYRDIVHFVSREALTLEQEGLIAYITKYFNPINQFNLYIITKNYEQHTRKLFKKYFPFPMMYNQPLKFYYSAQRVVRTVGLDSRGPGFFSFNGTSQSIAETEMINEDSEVNGDTKPISALHEKQLLAKSKSKEMLRESTFKIKCLNLIEKTIHQVNQVSNSNTEIDQVGNSTTEVITTTTTQENSAANVLLSSYLIALTSPLPDDFITSYMSNKYPTLLEQTKAKKIQFDQILSSIPQRDSQGEETPSLWNEAKYLYSIIWAGSD